jgi:hypothetical protein
MVGFGEGKTMRYRLVKILAVLIGLLAAMEAVADVSRTESGTGISIETMPDGASVYLNGRYAGLSPYVDPSLAPGLYRIRVGKPGYYDRDLTVVVGTSDRLILLVELKEIRGRIAVTVVPSDADIYIDGDPAGTGPNEAREGTHTVAARAFGYEESTVQVAVSRASPASVDIILKPAVLDMSPISVSRRLLNPENPSPIGSTTLSFSVTGPSAGEARITGPSGDTVARRDLGNFATWKQSFQWNGRRGDGAALPDGEYRIVVTAKDGTRTVSQEAHVVIDSSALIGPRGSETGLPGLALVPLGSMSPPATTMVTVSGASPLPPSPPFPFALSVSTVPVPGLTVGFRTVLPIGSNDYGVGLAGGIEYSRVVSRGALPLAISPMFRFSWAISGSSPTGEDDGIELGVPVQVGFGSVSCIVSPGLVVASGSGSAYTGIVARAGIVYEKNGFFGGISGKTGAFAPGGSTPGFPAEAAVEAHWLIPGTTFAPGIAATTTFRSASSSPTLSLAVSLQALL